MNGMNALPRYIAICITLVLVFTTASGAAENTGTSLESADFQIEMKDGLLTLETHDAPLQEVVRGIGELAGFETILVEDFVEPPLVSVSFESIPVREAVERLVSDKNRIVIYSPTGDEDKRLVISQVWLLGSSSASGEGEVKDEKTIATAQEKAVKGHKLVRLTNMLQEDQEAFVRARAAIALGALRDERAVLALESTLLDTHSSVRSQAINALGRIGGEQATMVLGNILLHGSADKSERVMAAHALWKINSEAARGYLRAGAYDTDEQVRMASSKTSSPPNIRATNSQLGDAETQ